MTQLEQFKLLEQCYVSDLERLDAVAEAAWYLQQLPSTGEDGQRRLEDHSSLIVNCRKEQVKIRANLAGLRDLLSTYTK